MPSACSAASAQSRRPAVAARSLKTEGALAEGVTSLRDECDAGTPRYGVQHVRNAVEHPAMIWQHAAVGVERVIVLAVEVPYTNLVIRSLLR